MRKCRYCGGRLGPGQSSAFCDKNPNREAAKEAYFRGSKRYRRVRRENRESLRKLITTPVIPIQTGWNEEQRGEE